MILSLGCQHDLSKDLHLIDKLFKVWIGRSARDGNNEYIRHAFWPRCVLVVCYGMIWKCQKQVLKINGFFINFSQTTLIMMS
jgi:hypothetical protein